MGELIRIAGTADVKPGAGMVAEVNGKAIALFNVDGTFYAIDNTCVAPRRPAGRRRRRGRCRSPVHGTTGSSM